MIILAIDPGPETSGSCLYNTEERKVLWSSSDISNEVLLDFIRDTGIETSIPYIEFDAVAIETIESMGLAIGKSTINTAIWVGRFYQCVIDVLVEPPYEVKLISRGDEKITLCGCKTFLDPVTGKRQGVKNAQIRQAVIDRFPPTGGGKRPQVGTKKKPGPLYGVSSHAWSAVAIALTFEEHFYK